MDSDDQMIKKMLQHVHEQGSISEFELLSYFFTIYKNQFNTFDRIFKYLNENELIYSEKYILLEDGEEHIAYYMTIKGIRYLKTPIIILKIQERKAIIELFIAIVLAIIAVFGFLGFANINIFDILNGSP
jgi:hypothetical protein